jgi:hypothetical protein
MVQVMKRGMAIVRSTGTVYHADPSRMGGMKRRWLLLTYALINAALYSMLLPLWEGFDEPFHFGYVQYLANGNGFPDPRTSVLSKEVGASLLLAPASLSVQRNLSEVTTYSEFFGWPESKRERTHQRLSQIDPGLRWQRSDILDYEALQAPLAYAIMALPERALALTPLPVRVMLLRITAGTLGSLLLFFGAERLLGQLDVPGEHQEIAIFCAFSCQMIWATLAHVANDWLAVPLTLWLLLAAIHYDDGPSVRRALLASGVLAMGLLTKAYFIALIPLPISVCILHRRWRDLVMTLVVVSALAGPWYLRNLERYGVISGMQELRQGTDPMLALQAVQAAKVPAALDSYARGALWTANNSFRSFSVKTLRSVLVTWLATLVLWAVTRHRRAEWIVILFSGLFILALAYDGAINYVASHHESASPGAWYMQVLLVPLLALGLLGASRSGRTGRAAGLVMVLLFGYILAATYWVKLMPLYGGFTGRTSLTAVTILYWDRLPNLMAGLNEVCLAPARVIVGMASLVTILAVAQQVISIRRLFVGPRRRRDYGLRMDTDAHG